MQALFYHDRPMGLGARLARLTGIVALGVVCAMCGQPARDPSPAAAPTPSIPAAGSGSGPAQAITPTASAIAEGRAIIEQIRVAAGGKALTDVRSFELAGTSTMTSVKIVRRLSVRALFPMFFRLEESTPPNLKGPPFHTVTGLEGDFGFLLGARLGGDGQAKDQDVARRAYTQAARQTMVGYLAGINAPWLIDSGKFTPTIAPAETAGPDRDAIVVLLDGPDGRAGRLLVDPNTHLPRRLIEPPQPRGGTAAVADIVFTYSDFQPQAGLQLPHTIVRENGRNRTVWSIQKYTINPKLTPRRFARASR